MSKQEQITGIFVIIGDDEERLRFLNNALVQAKNGTIWRCVTIEQFSNFVHRMQGSKSFFKNFYSSLSKN